MDIRCHTLARSRSISPVHGFCNKLIAAVDVWYKDKSIRTNYIWRQTWNTFLKYFDCHKLVANNRVCRSTERPRCEACMCRPKFLWHKSIYMESYEFINSTDPCPSYSLKHMHLIINYAFKALIRSAKPKYLYGWILYSHFM